MANFTCNNAKNTNIISILINFRNKKKKISNDK